MDDDQKKKLAGECFRKGSEAMTAENWDFAVSMFGQCVTFVPENLMYRQVLRGSQRKKYKDNGSGAGKIARMGLIKIRTRLKKAHMSKETDWENIAKTAEEGLQVNPWDAHLNFELGVACRELGYIEIARFSMEDAAKSESDNKEVARTLAALLQEVGDFSASRKMWERVYKLDPTDGEARSKMTHVDAESVMVRGGYEKAENTRDVKQTAYDLDRPSQSKMPESVDGPGVSAEADLQHAIRKDEANPDNYVKLAAFYRGEKRYDEATSALRTALDASGGDQNIRELVEDAELEQLRYNFELAKEAARSNGDDEAARKTAAGLRKELWQREVEVFQGRIERYPKDSLLKFELSKRFIQAKQFPKAIPLLQQCTADKRLECDVLVSLGECFINAKNEKLGRRQLEKVVEIVNPIEQPELFKKAHYVLGRICEKVGERDQAEDHYNEVIGAEYGYRDALARLEKLQSGEADGGDSDD
jgi:tetratricopeptide (TPR) repeat protein